MISPPLFSIAISCSLLTVQSASKLFPIMQLLLQEDLNALFNRTTFANLNFNLPVLYWCIQVSFKSSLLYLRYCNYIRLPATCTFKETGIRLRNLASYAHVWNICKSRMGVVFGYGFTRKNRRHFGVYAKVKAVFPCKTRCQVS